MNDFMTFIAPREIATPAAPAADSAASDFALPEALKLVIQQHAAEVARKVADAYAATKATAAFHERIKTDKALVSRFRTNLAQYAAKHGVSEPDAYPPVLAEFLKEF